MTPQRGSKHARIAAFPSVPTAGETIRFAMAAGALYKIPDIFRGKMLDLIPVGSAVQVSAGDANVSVTLHAVAAVDGGTRAITPNSASGTTYPEGVRTPIRFKSTDTHFYVLPVTASASNYFEIAVSSPSAAERNL